MLFEGKFPEGGIGALVLSILANAPLLENAFLTCKYVSKVKLAALLAELWQPLTAQLWFIILFTSILYVIASGIGSIKSSELSEEQLINNNSKMSK